jgi:hypothetical protein
MKEEEREYKPTCKGEGRCNRFLEWLEINVTRWNRKKQVYYISGKYFTWVMVSVIILALIGVACIVTGAFTGNDLFIHVLPFVFLMPALLAEIICLPPFFILICFRRVRFTPSNPLETPLPS